MFSQNCVRKVGGPSRTQHAIISAGQLRRTTQLPNRHVKRWELIQPAYMILMSTILLHVSLFYYFSGYNTLAFRLSRDNKASCYYPIVIPVKVRYQSVEVRLEMLYYPLLVFNYNMVLFPDLFLALINDIIQYYSSGVCKRQVQSITKIV